MSNSNEQESAILLNKTAVKALKQANIKPSRQIKNELYRQVQSLQNQREQLYRKYKKYKKIQKQDQIIEQNLTQVLKLNHTKILDRE